MRILTIILTVIILFGANTAIADNYMLPQSFSIKDEPLPELPKIEKQASKDESTQPQQLTTLSLTDLIKNFDYEYTKTFHSTMNTLVQFNIKPLVFDSSKGQIRAKLSSGKEIFILLLPSQEKLTHVRITPADGDYNLSAQLVDSLFKSIAQNLCTDIN